MSAYNKSYRGRFAPTPSGELHFGSLVTAVASYIDAKYNNGTWLVRIEDADTIRCLPKYGTSILKTLENFSLFWDEEVIFQSQRNNIYQGFLEELLKQNKAFFCNCSRNDLLNVKKGIDGSPVYWGKCRNTSTTAGDNYAVRLRVDKEIIKYDDAVFGCFSQDISEEVGDFVIKRVDGFFAYHFACVVDDYLQKTTTIVRGSDLLNSVARQVFLQKQLGFNLLNYIHIPVVLSNNGEKLSKQTGALAVDYKNASALLYHALTFLGQNPIEELRHQKPQVILKWGIDNWDIAKIARLPGIFYTL